MLKLWFMIEYRKDYKNKLVSYFKFICNFILPTLLGYIISINSDLVFSPKVHMEFVIISNLIIIAITHYILQKLFFSKLESDVIIKFLQGKMYNYIKVRLFMILLKWNLPFILPSILGLKRIFSRSNFIFYLSAILFIVSWFLINYLIALYVRYIINTTKGIKRFIVNTVIYIIYFMLIIVLPQYIAYKILDNIDTTNKNYNMVRYSNINIYCFITIVIILIFSILLVSFTRRYFQINIRKIIINKKINKRFKANKRFDKYIRILIRVFSGKLTNLEEKIIIKDIKDLCRANKVSFSFAIIMQGAITALLVYIYYNSVPNNFKEALAIFPTIDLIVFMFMVILFINGNMGFRNYFRISCEVELLNKYGIQVSEENMINIKRKLATIMLFLSIYTFFIIVFITIINIWSWITIALSLISILIVEKLISLILVKRVNNKNSNNIIIQLLNYLMLGACVTVFKFIFINSANLEVYFIFNALLIVGYLFNYNVNINKTKGNKEDV